jgi:hypothetical protein
VLKVLVEEHKLEIRRVSPSERYKGEEVPRPNQSSSHQALELKYQRYKNSGKQLLVPPRLHQNEASYIDSLDVGWSFSYSGYSPIYVDTLT